MKGKGTGQWKYAWIPVLGPIMGSCIAAFLYMLLEWLKSQN